MLPAVVAGSRIGFAPLPDTDNPALAAARKSRATKNRLLVKIGAAVVAASAFLAGLAAFLLTRSSSPHIAAR